MIKLWREWKNWFKVVEEWMTNQQCNTWKEMVRWNIVKNIFCKNGSENVDRCLDTEEEGNFSDICSVRDIRILIKHVIDCFWYYVVFFQNDPGPTKHVRVKSEGDGFFLCFLLSRNFSFRICSGWTGCEPDIPTFHEYLEVHWCLRDSSLEKRPNLWPNHWVLWVKIWSIFYITLIAQSV